MTPGVGPDGQPTITLSAEEAVAAANWSEECAEFRRAYGRVPPLALALVRVLRAAVAMADIGDVAHLRNMAAADHECGHSSSMQTLNECAKATGQKVRTLQYRAAHGLLPGAVRSGSVWLVPTTKGDSE